jgi:hypothetical protein
MATKDTIDVTFDATLVTRVIDTYCRHQYRVSVTETSL